MNQALARALAARKYEEPTPVQSAVLEPEASGRDLLVSAQTGSGKTVAFGTAIAETILGEAEQFGPAGAPLALVVAPTRELALQVQRELQWLYAETGARITSCVGGMDIRREAKALSFGAHIVVGTPGRLRDHIERHRLDLSALKAVVLDEADEMLDLGFREDLEFILSATPEGRRTLLFSATIAPEIAELAKTYQSNAHRIQTARRNEAHGDIEYRAVRVVGHEMERAIVNVLRFFEGGSAIVFCSTREAVKRLHGSLFERGFSAVALSGELSQAERNNALQSLRDGRARLCVATDVAARGIDLPDLGLVIHADLPNDHETLLHRSGRTGRAGRKGLCLLMVPPFKRRRAEMLLRGANVTATWMGPPSADDIRAKDHDRLLNDPAFDEETSEDDVALVKAMLEKRSAEDVAGALVRILRARLPAPEEVNDPGAGTFRERRPSEGAPFEKGPPRDRLKDDETVWFRINIGRNRNAEPRWMIPLICKAGGITKNEIGSIRIFDNDSRFQIAKDKADAFAEAVKGAGENNTVITPAFGPAGGFGGRGRPAEGGERPFRKGPFKPRPRDGEEGSEGRPERRFEERKRTGGGWTGKPFGKPHFKARGPAGEGAGEAGGPGEGAQRRSEDRAEGQGQERGEHNREHRNDHRGPTNPDWKPRGPRGDKPDWKSGPKPKRDWKDKPDWKAKPRGEDAGAGGGQAGKPAWKDKPFRKKPWAAKGEGVADNRPAGDGPAGEKPYKWKKRQKGS